MCIYAHTNNEKREREFEGESGMYMGGFREKKWKGEILWLKYNFKTETKMEDRQYLLTLLVPCNQLWGRHWASLALGRGILLFSLEAIFTFFSCPTERAFLQTVCPSRRITAFLEWWTTVWSQLTFYRSGRQAKFWCASDFNESSLTPSWSWV